MSTTAFEHGTPWTDEEYLALGATSDRVELFDGSLHVTPGPTAGHQTIARRLANALDGPGERAGLEAYEALNVRLRRGRLPIPDVVLCRPLAPHEHVAEADTVALVCEITSPGNAATDRVLKMYYYAEAGIPWYLLIDPDPLLLRLLRLDGDHYVDHTTADRNEVLVMTEPVHARIAAASLVRGARHE